MITQKKKFTSLNNRSSIYAQILINRNETEIDLDQGMWPRRSGVGWFHGERSELRWGCLHGGMLWSWRSNVLTDKVETETERKKKGEGKQRKKKAKWEAHVILSCKQLGSRCVSNSYFIWPFKNLEVIILQFWSEKIKYYYL